MTTWVLFDDPRTDSLRPLTWLRPASELRFGAETLEARWRRLVGDDPVRVVCRDELATLRPGRTAWRDCPGFGDGTLWVSDRLVPDRSVVEALRGLGEGRCAQLGDRVVAFHPVPKPVPDERSPGDGETAAQVLGVWAPILETDSGPTGLELATGGFLGGLGDLVGTQARLLEEDLERLLSDDNRGAADASAADASAADARAADARVADARAADARVADARVAHARASDAQGDDPGRDATGDGPLGDGFGYARERIRLAPSVRIDHGAVLDARDGGIVLGPECEVRSGTYLRGPLIAAERCLFLGGTIGSGSTFGPVSRVRGEVETTVFLGYSNKAHDGFVGHSYIGEWVNLGALTTTSDLKNDYGEVSLDIDGVRTPTGSNKVGTFFGDHVKTRIGCLLNTGTVVGLGANVFGNAAVAERYLADFQWGTAPDAMEYRIDKFLRVARTVLGRRGVEWTEDYEAALRIAYQGSQPVRERTLAHA